MKNEYIRRADAVDALDELRVNSLDAENGLLLLSGIAAASDTIESLEPADVAPVVRCENCIHWSDSNQCARPELSGSRWHDPKYFDTYPDDFCSYGERKE